MKNYIMVLIGTLLVGCSAGTQVDVGQATTEAAGEASGPVKASDIILGDPPARGIARAEGKVYASEVTIEKAGTVLSSETLQDALSDEIAVDYSEALTNSRWVVTKATHSSTHAGDTVEFSGNGITHTAEYLPGLGIMSASGRNVSYTVYQNKILLVEYDSGSDEETQRISTTVMILSVSRDEIGFVHMGTGQMIVLQRAQ